MHHRDRGAVVRHHPGPGGHQRFVIHRRDGKMMGGHHGINRHRNYKRIERGFIVPHFWWGPRFHVQNWGMYGFPQPMHGRRWVRYYDDALLIDHAGRVHDGRWGMNWDRYEDRWAHDEQGVPYYDGDSDYYPDDEDHAYADGEAGPYAEHHGPPPPPCARACHPPMRGYGHAYPHGYGAYGWMHGGMVTITETTVHAAAPQVVTETVYIEKKVKAKPRRSYKRAKPRPRPGERG
jgi:Ni/Co efflux regulator RcnB